MVCVNCERIGAAAYAVISGPGIGAVAPHSTSLKALQDSAGAGCGSCVLIIETAVEQIGQKRLSNLPAGKDTLSYEVTYGFNPNLSQADHVLFYFGHSDDFRSMIPYVETFTMELVEEPRSTQNDRGRPAFTGRMVDQDPFSPACVRMIHEWKENCDASHANCHAANSSQQLPTRIIDVGPSNGAQDPFLFISNKTHGEYIALSHVWGGHIPLRTLSSNIKAHCQTIAPSSLPPTFLDAIKVTRSLGYQYLWIDSLCIIQDSKRDWEIECTKMADIYSKASLVLAAVDAPNSTVGFLRPRSVTPFAEIYTKGTSSLRIMPMRGHCADEVRDTLLEKRSWCYQEQVLGPRILSFGKEMITWDCREVSLVEAASVPRPSKLKLTVDGAFGNELVRTSWIRAVGLFAQRAITKANDRLPALSGIARQYAEGTGFHYCAGIWKEALVDELGWIVEKNEYRPFGPAGRPQGTPSWSWAAHVSGVSFPDRQRFTDVKIVDISVKLAGLDPYGQVDGGLLTVRGKTRKACVCYQKSNPEEYTSVSYVDQCQSLRDIGTGADVGRCSFDDWSSPWIQIPGHGGRTQAQQLDLFCLEVSKGKTRGHAILLTPSSTNRQRYLRIGICSVKVDWFDGAAPETLVIV